MKQLFTGGRVFTAVRGSLWAEAVVVEGAHIAFVGDAADAARFAGADAELIDLDGRVVVPGFVDAHAHVIGTGEALTKAQLRDAASLDDIVTEPGADPPGRCSTPRSPIGRSTSRPTTSTPPG
jgi:predicted amidohydrolase YtcJ